jgi:nucleotide-binding universal stress UspA family protein
MKTIKNILCILSLSDTDKFTIKYTAFIAEIAGVENIFVNFINELHNVPDYAKHLYPQETIDANPDVIRKIKEDIITVQISNIKAKVYFNVFDKGSIHDNCLKFILDKQIDLVIYRKNLGNPDSISFAAKLVRRSICSVLIIVKNFSTFGRILVSVDFSNQSKKALEAGISLSQLANISAIDLLHVVEITGINVLKTTHNYEENIKKLNDYVKEEGKKFIENCDRKGVEINIIYEINEKTDQGIFKIIKDRKIDLVLIGAQGRTSGISIFLGSVAESLIKNLDIPILVIKKKGTGLHILEKIFGN